MSVTSNWSGRLVAFVDYEIADIDRGEYVLLRVDDVFLQFNRTKGFNNGTGEYQDKVVLVQQESARFRYSNLLGGLGAKESFSRNGVTFEVCTLNLSGPPDYAEFRIYPTGTPSTCG